MESEVRSFNVSWLSRLSSRSFFSFACAENVSARNPNPPVPHLPMYPHIDSSKNWNPVCSGQPLTPFRRSLNITFLDLWYVCTYLVSPRLPGANIEFTLNGVCGSISTRLLLSIDSYTAFFPLDLWFYQIIFHDPFPSLNIHSIVIALFVTC